MGMLLEVIFFADKAIAIQDALLSYQQGLQLLLVIKT